MAYEQSLLIVLAVYHQICIKTKFTHENCFPLFPYIMRALLITLRTWHPSISKLVVFQSINFITFYLEPYVRFFRYRLKYFQRNMEYSNSFCPRLIFPLQYKYPKHLKITRVIMAFQLFFVPKYIRKFQNQPLIDLTRCPR